MRVFSLEHRKKLSESKIKAGIKPPSRLGQKAWNKGLVGFMANEKNGMWKGENAGYRALHDWVKRNLGEAKRCSNSSNHISTRYEWANISGEYKRDLKDWHELCPSCNKTDGVRVAPRFLKEGELYA